LTAGEAYQAEAPTLWDVGFRTAVAQAELEDREHPGAWHRIAFHTEGGDPVFIETTRPELLPACVALIAHPDDERYQALFGTTVRTARERMVAMLREAGDLDGEPRKIVRPVKFYEKGDKPLEIVSSRQWFIRSVVHQDVLLRRSAELHWHPGYMKARFDDWVRGLNGDWLVSRQRFFGVPFPLWYPL